MGELIEAVEGGDLERVRALVSADPAAAGERDSAGVPALLAALYRGRRDLAEEIAAARPELDVFEAAAMGRAERLRKLLAERPGLARAWTDDGFTALHYAAFFGTHEAAAALIAAGADAGAPARNAMKVTPLHSAAAMGANDTARLLLEADSPANAAQEGGYTALHSAAANGNEELVRLLLDHDADPAQAKDDGETPGDLARERGHADLAAVLEPS